MPVLIINQQPIRPITNPSFRGTTFLSALAGAKEGDFTMVFGFPAAPRVPARCSYVELIMNEQNPNRVALRELRIRTAESFMHGNDTITLMYASKVKSLANAYKNGRAKHSASLPITLLIKSWNLNTASTTGAPRLPETVCRCN